MLLCNLVLKLTILKLPDLMNTSEQGGALSSISLPIERAPPISNSLHAIYHLAPLCACILYLVYCNIVFFGVKLYIQSM